MAGKDEYDKLWYLFVPQDEGQSPVITAAGSADPSVLRNILEKATELTQADYRTWVLDFTHDESLNPRWQTVLLHAIEKRRPENIRMLIANGFNPNGVCRRHQANYARRFRRFTYPYEYGGYPTPHDRCVVMDEELVGAVSSQNIPLTDEELSVRRSTVSNFWVQGTNSIGIGLSHIGDLLHSLVMAAASTPAIFDQVLEAGAECQFWKNECNSTSTVFAAEGELSPSELCVSTPLHSAIAANETQMPTTILDRGFNPNARALIVGSQALTPMQFAILLGNTRAYEVLSGHALANPEILTPVLGVHITHIAAALLRIDLLQTIDLPLTQVPLTTLGHSLLHITCLPYEQDDVPQRASKVRQSFHDTRALHTPWHAFGMFNMWSSIGYHRPSGEEKGREIEPIQSLQTAEMFDMLRGRPKRRDDEAQQQEEMCKHLIAALGPKAIEAEDVYGNTALHYLACATDFNAPLVEWFKSWDEGKTVWRQKPNSWVHA